MSASKETKSQRNHISNVIDKHLKPVVESLKVDNITNHRETRELQRNK
jgi:hypothetical protein